MRKRILSILLTLCMVFCIMPTGVFAEGETFKNVSSAAELKNALADSSVPGIRLTKDIVTGEAFSVTRTVTLDLNGYMLKMTGNDSVIRVEKKSHKIGDLTLIDSRPTTEHRFKADDKTGRWMQDDSGDITVKGGVITSTGTEQRSGGGGVAVSADTKFTMDGGNIVGCDSDKLGSGVYVSFGTFTMTGGRIAGCGNDPGIYLEVWAIMNANGGEVDATVALRENSKITTRDDLAGVTVFRKKVNVIDADSYGVVKYGLFYVPPSNGTPREIVYMANGALYAVQIMPSESSNPAVEPEIPTSNTGSTFLGWYKADGTKWNFTRDVVNDHICVAARWDTAQQFSGVEVGKTYYFDLLGENIPGTVNANLPDTTLHYVPFTYVGTLDGYVLKPASGGVLDSSDKAANTTDSSAPYGHAYLHSLFIADHILTTDVSYDMLNAADYIFGNSCTVNDVDYTLRAPTIGNNYASSASQGIPENNEWDQILFKDSGFIKNLLLATPSWSQIWTWGQDTDTSGSIIRSVRSGRNQLGGAPTRFDTHVGYRPVLELPTDLAADSLKVVELVTAGYMPGEQQNWINIIVKKGESFTAPSAEGLPLSDGISADTPMWWVDENLNFYKPGDTVPADVSALTALWGGFGLFLDRGDGEVEVTPDNYTDIFDDGTASFVLPKGRSLTELGESVNLTSKDILEIYSTGRLERYGCVFPNLKLKNADLTSVRLSKKFIGRENPLFITLDGKNTVGSLNRISMSRNTLSVLGDGSLTLNSALTLSQYTQYGGGSVTMTDGLTAYDLSIDSGSLTVTGDPQAITLRDQDISNLYMGDGVRLFTGSSAQDAAEADVPQLSAKMQEVYKRYQAEDNTLTYEELSALNNALREQFNAIFRQLSGKTYVRITGAWDVTYQPGENGDGNAVTDIKFYNDILTLRGKLFTRTGYTQTGWATVDGGEKVYGFEDVYTQNAALTLYPVWNTNKYTITFDTNGGSAIAPITQDYGTAITAPANPTRKGYTFIGWDKAIPATMPAENVTITAKWEINQYTITFDTAGGSTVAPITQDYGTAITAPANPTKEGYTFIGWDKAIPATMPAENVTITAKCKVNSYAITFDTVGGSEIAPITQDYGTAITAPADPTREGYTFIGWDMEIPTTMPAENMIVTAQWEINRYTITFDTAGGSEIASITQDYGTQITAPADPTREGYTFVGWDKAIPTTMPAENITLKARWKDSEKPTGEIVIGTNKWRDFLNTLTFGLFFKDTQEVTINAADNSGTVFVSYLVTDQDLSEAELGSLVYRAYEEPFRIDPNGEYIVYVMLVDESLNITYLRSDRITLDNVQPVITGIENGKTYCEAQTVTVDEKYVGTVTVNGTEVTLDENGSFTLSPADGGQKIVVTDNAGNTAEMTVTVNDGHTGGKATCTERAVCEVCGKAYGEPDPKNHTDLKHISAKAATEDAEGNIEYWYCSGCNQYYSDKDGTKEIKKADTVMAKLPKSPQTGDTSNLALWITLLFISGSVFTVLTVKRKKSY